MDERDPGILGNLPNSRPGTRSQKRATTAKPRGSGPPRSSGTPRSSAAPRSATARRKPARPRRTAAAEEAARRAVQIEEPQAGAAGEAEPERPGGPQGAIAGALTLAGRVAATGVQVGTGVAREVLRRLPGPW